MPKLNLSLLEELYKDDDVREFNYAIRKDFPSILKTLRAYEQAIEKVRDMDNIRLTCLCVEGAEAHRQTEDFWRAKRDIILNSLDKALKEIE